MMSLAQHCALDTRAELLNARQMAGRALASPPRRTMMSSSAKKCETSFSPARTRVCVRKFSRKFRPYVVKWRIAAQSLLESCRSWLGRRGKIRGL
jgi:hypothetical protein